MDTYHKLEHLIFSDRSRTFSIDKQDIYDLSKQLPDLSELDQRIIILFLYNTMAINRLDATIENTIEVFRDIQSVQNYLTKSALEPECEAITKSLCEYLLCEHFQYNAFEFLKHLENLENIRNNLDMSSKEYQEMSKAIGMLYNKALCLPHPRLIGYMQDEKTANSVKLYVYKLSKEIEIQQDVYFQARLMIHKLMISCHYDTRLLENSDQILDENIERCKFSVSDIYNNGELSEKVENYIKHGITIGDIQNYYRLASYLSSIVLTCEDSIQKEISRYYGNSDNTKNSIVMHEASINFLEYNFMSRDEDDFIQIQYSLDHIWNHYQADLEPNIHDPHTTVKIHHYCAFILRLICIFHSRVADIPNHFELIDEAFHKVHQMLTKVNEDYSYMTSGIIDWNSYLRKVTRVAVYSENIQNLRELKTVIQEAFIKNNNLFGFHELMLNTCLLDLTAPKEEIKNTVDIGYKFLPYVPLPTNHPLILSLSYKKLILQNIDTDSESSYKQYTLVLDEVGSNYHLRHYLDIAKVTHKQSSEKKTLQFDLSTYNQELISDLAYNILRVQLSFSQLIEDNIKGLISVLQLVNYFDHTLNENIEEVIYLLKTGQEIIVSEPKITVAHIDSYIGRHIEVYKTISMTSKRQIEFVQDIAKYLSFTPFSSQLDQISAELGQILDDKVDEYKITGNLLIETCIIKGRYYYEKNKSDKSKNEFIKALKLAKKQGYTDIDIWNHQKESNEEDKDDDQIDFLKMSVNSSTSLKNSIALPTLSGADIPEIMYDIPFFLILMDQNKKDREQTFYDAQYLLQVSCTHNQSFIFEFLTLSIIIDVGNES